MKQEIITLPFEFERAAPAFEKQDIKMPESLVRHFLKRFTKEGARVFDPFIGLGTTAFICEEMRCVPYGLELDRRRHSWVARQLKTPENIVQGDALQLSSYDWPKFDFALTSPPYMPKHHKWNPLVKDEKLREGYQTYLSGIRQVFDQLSICMKRGANIVVQVDNLYGKKFTSLAWDIARVISSVDKLRLEGEVIARWDKGASSDTSYTYCLIFKAL